MDLLIRLLWIKITKELKIVVVRTTVINCSAKIPQEMIVWLGWRLINTEKRPFFTPQINFKTDALYIIVKLKRF